MSDPTPHKPDDEQASPCDADTKSYTIHIGIGVTTQEHSTPARQFFHLSGFKTLELADQYKEWLHKCLTSITDRSMITDDKNQPIRITHPAITISSESCEEVLANDNFKLNYYHYFIYTLTAILGKFGININSIHRDLLFAMKFD